jgi:cob(I)alamin adenosyltransferase
MKIYTKTGDNGTTGLFAGPRVSKSHPRIEAYGTVDELNALLGAAVASLEPGTVADPTTAGSSHPGEMQQEENWRLPIARLLIAIQSDLFALGAQLATPDPEKHGMCLLTEDHITALESGIDELEEQLVPLSNFVLPGGSPIAAWLHMARTVCRRAERQLVALAQEPGVTHCQLPIVYLNRLSDLLFSAARYSNARMNIPDRPWSRPDDK